MIQVKGWETKAEAAEVQSVLYHSLCWLPSTVFIFLTVIHENSYLPRIWMQTIPVLYPRPKYIKCPAFNYSYKISFNHSYSFYLTFRSSWYLKDKGKEFCWGSQWATVSQRNGPAHFSWSANNRAAVTSKWRMGAFPATAPRGKEKKPLHSQAEEHSASSPGRQSCFHFGVFIGLLK